MTLVDEVGRCLPQLLADLESLVRCESPSADLAAVARSADLVAAMGTERLGVRPERIEVDGCAHLSFRFGAGPIRVLDADGSLLAIGQEIGGGLLQPVVVLV